MARIAIDIVLLPDEKMTDTAIEANKKLIAEYSKEIVLNKENCLPHVSLAMGCIDEKDIEPIEQILKAIIKENPLNHLQAIKVSAVTNAKGQNVSVFSLKKTQQLQSLHEQVMTKLQSYFSCDVTADMVNAEQVSDSTLSWIKNYADDASFEKFHPHITIGYGQAEPIDQPISFHPDKLALCHLGNHCTCTIVLSAIGIKACRI